MYSTHAYMGTYDARATHTHTNIDISCVVLHKRKRQTVGNLAINTLQGGEGILSAVEREREREREKESELERARKGEREREQEGATFS